MKVGFRESFLKDVARVKDKRLLQRVRATIESVEKAGSLERLPGLKKIERRRQFLFTAFALEILGQGWP